MKGPILINARRGGPKGSLLLSGGEPSLQERMIVAGWEDPPQKKRRMSSYLIAGPVEEIFSKRGGEREQFF